MRSSMPANEILQMFHKVNPSYPMAWSLEIKSLLRKVQKDLQTYYRRLVTLHLTPTFPE